MEQNIKVVHQFEPVYDQYSKILILGSFPSVKSREQHFYYGHPQNRFWKMLAYLTKKDFPDTVEKRKAFLLENHIAVWDVIHSCTIRGSSDSSIRDVVPNDITQILDTADIAAVLSNGGKAYELYQKYIYQKTRRESIKMPSTSPANATCSFVRLCEVYGRYIPYR